MYSQSDPLYTPRYLLRRKTILQYLSRRKPGRFLEMGCGQGELLPWLAKLGFEGVGLEISESALAKAEQATRRLAPHIRVTDDPESLHGERFDYLFAFEVLEHIEDDRRALAEWSEWIAPGGILVLTVPARMKYWTGADDFGGHCRRYERAQLAALISQTGFRVQDLWSWGFPLTSLTRHGRSIAYRHRPMNAEDRSERTLRSSFDSTRTTGWHRLDHGLNESLEVVAEVARILQSPFRGLDLGDGYLAAGEKL